MSRRLPSRRRPIDRTRADRLHVRRQELYAASRRHPRLGAARQRRPVVGRSFKYHRPRGVFGHRVEEPNAIFDISRDGRREPNARATTTFLEEGVGLEARSINAFPDAARDLSA